ncbi:hypothetical protein GGR95_001531 [Sulfitobacter undariae]|uniref:AbrB family transcriptional regulator n=1 Tax=Sulfitobacter undariae TaxID=1563671 RepID=A0A7W6E8B9_9RHOB|nr:AbrB family transcriptional regulator [Sulfitobacter undariae]MBB3993900.1 hypothetical protein [Sulfitobacter undariae]
MIANFFTSLWGRTMLTLAVACVGAIIAWAIRAPMFLLIGPAFAVSLAGLIGLQTQIHPRFRDACFVVMGLTVGAGFSAEAVATMGRWPLAFLMMAGLTWATMAACRAVLVRFFGFSRGSALLAGAPGHLSFVISMAESSGADVMQISVTQSVRLLLLTMVVPFIVVAMGVDLSGAILQAGISWPMWLLAVMVVAALLASIVLARLNVPAPLLIGAMLVAGIWQLSGIRSGVMPPELVMPAYVALGALIGTRFVNVKMAELLRNLGAGFAITGVAVVLAGAGAFAVAWAMGMAPSHVLLAFAPGGLETMIAMGVVMGAVPGFVAACHMTRLMVLSVLLPLMARGVDGSGK